MKCIFAGFGRFLNTITSLILYLLKYWIFHCCQCKRVTYEASLPQKETDPSTRARRARQIEIVRGSYQLEQMTFGLSPEEQEEISLVDIPPLLHEIPVQESRSPLNNIRFYVRVFYYKIHQLRGRISCTERWSIKKMTNYLLSSRIYSKPKACEMWTEFKMHDIGTSDIDSKITEKDLMKADHWFAWKRLNGVNRNLIRAVTGIPEKFQDHVEKENHPYLGPETDLFFEVDLAQISEDSQNMPSLTALFVVYSEMLMPVAISNNKKVFLPVTVGDDRKKIEKWTKEKMIFDMMDAQYHESITHLGFTHMLMDGVSVCAHRNFSERHPLLILLTPHFRYMHQINYLAVAKLLNKNGYIDEDMLISRRDMLGAVAKHNKKWRLDKQGSFKNDLIERGVENRENLPGYYFRDDASMVHEAIEDFVQKYVDPYYECNDDVVNDYELQNFREELTKSRNLNGTGGCGMQGVPEFINKENVVTTLTSLIFICSVEHSATNFPQFDQYGYPPNHPAILTMAEDKTGTEDIDVLMPTVQQFFSTLTIMKILTMVITNKLGKYEEEYVDKMDEKAQGILKSFQDKLSEIQKEITKRNDEIEKSSQKSDGIGEIPYIYLLPENILNSISI